MIVVKVVKGGMEAEDGGGRDRRGTCTTVPLYCTCNM